MRKRGERDRPEDVMGFSRVVLDGICIQSICHQPLSSASAILDLEYLPARIYRIMGTILMVNRTGVGTVIRSRALPTLKKLLHLERE